MFPCSDSDPLPPHPAEAFDTRLTQHQLQFDAETRSWKTPAVSSGRRLSCPRRDLTFLHFYLNCSLLSSSLDGARSVSIWLVFKVKWEGIDVNTAVNSIDEDHGGLEFIRRSQLDAGGELSGSILINIYQNCISSFISTPFYTKRLKCNRGQLVLFLISLQGSWRITEAVFY